MKLPIIFTLYNHSTLVNNIISSLSLDLGQIIFREFPDQETYLKFNTSIKDREIILIDSLDQPNDKILPLLFFARTAKDLGAKRVGLVAPYLSYMRQDKIFHPGESLTSRYFAQLLSYYFDWLITIEPHLHRYKSLQEIYSIPAVSLSVAEKIAHWIDNNITRPVIIGPDAESYAWISKIAKIIDAPYFTLNKTRHGDRQIEITLPEIKNYLNLTPVLVDDIISTGQTLITANENLMKQGMQPAVCVGVHGIFSENSYQTLLQSSMQKIITCNTIEHETNAIDVCDIIIEAINNID